MGSNDCCQQFVSKMLPELTLQWAGIPPPGGGGGGGSNTPTCSCSMLQSLGHLGYL